MNGLLVVRADGDRHSRPQRCAQTVSQQERTPRHARHAGDWRSDQGESGNEFREEEGGTAPADKGHLDPVRGGLRHRKDAVDARQSAVSQAGARQVPHVVRDQGHDHGAGEKQRPGELLTRRECACDQQRRRCGKGQPGLRQEHVSPHQQQAVALDEECKLFQRDLPK